jgi:hypothetical protein
MNFDDICTTSLHNVNPESIFSMRGRGDAPIEVNSIWFSAIFAAFSQLS